MGGRVYEVWAQNTVDTFKMYGKDGPPNLDRENQHDAAMYAAELLKAAPPGEIIMIGVHQREEYT